MSKKVNNNNLNHHKLSNLEKSKDRAYWISKTVEERLAEAERLRREAYPNYDKLKLERVVKIIKKKTKRTENK